MHRNFRILFFIFFIIFHATNHISYGQDGFLQQLHTIDGFQKEWEIQNFLNDAGLLHRSQYDIDFEKNGTAWIAASNGLYKYDGYRWEKFSKENGLPSDFVRSVCITRNGVLWIGTDRGAGTFDGKTFDSHGSETGLAGPSISHIMEDREGHVWFCSDRWPNSFVSGGLSRYDGKTWIKESEKEGFTEDHLIEFFQASDGSYYALSNHTLLYKTDGRWENPLIKSGLYHGEHFRSIIEFPSNEILVFSDLGYYKKSGDVWSGRQISMEDRTINKPVCLDSEETIFSFRRTDNNQYNLVRWTEDRWESQYPVFTHYGFDWISSVKRAPDGSIWCLGDNILLRFIQNKNEWFHLKDFPKPELIDNHNQIWFQGEEAIIRHSTEGWGTWELYKGKIGIDRAGTVWGWNSGEIYRWDRNEKTTYTFPETGIHRVEGFAKAGKNGGWFHGKDTNQNIVVSLYHSEKWRNLFIPNTSNQKVVDVACDPEDALWLLVSTQPSPAYRMLGIQFVNDRAVIEEKPLPQLNTYPQMHIDRTGGFWIYYTLPLQRLPSASESQWQSVHRTIGEVVIDVFETPFSLWFQCNGGSGGTWGLSRKYGEQWSHVEDELYFGKILESGEAAAAGNVYLYISSDRPNSQPQPILLPHTGYVSGIVKSPQGRYWIGIDTDVYISNPDGVPPETEIELLSAQSLTAGDPLMIRCNASEYFLPRNPQKSFFYSWRIDTDPWSEYQRLNNSTLTIDTSAFPIGRHSIEISARDEMLDTDSSPAPIHFQIRQIPLQEQWWFKYTVVLIFSFICWLAAITWRSKKRLRKYANHLETTIEERTNSLRISEKKYRSLIDTTDTGFVILDSSGIVIDANQVYIELCGYQKLSEILGKPVTEWTAEYDRERNEREVKKCMEDGFVRNLEVDYVTPEEKIVPIEVNASVFPTKDGFNIISLCRDITERKKAEEALKNKTEELDQFFTLTLELLCIADTNGRFHKLNPHWEKTLGYSLEELYDLNFVDLLHPDDIGKTAKAVEDLTSQKLVVNFRNRYRCKDGTYRWIEWNSCPNGQRVFAAARDITERINAEEERRRMDEHIQQTQKLESLGILAGGIAHDFNNLLTAVMGQAELGIAKCGPHSPAHNNLTSIAQVAQRASDLCQQMLAYSGKGHFVIQSISLEELIQEMIHMLQISISKKAALQFQFCSDLPLIEGDASQIRQIVMNLIINASEAIGDSNGIITIKTGTMVCDRDSFTENWIDDRTLNGSYVYVEVSDTGKGMDRETVSKMFDPFFTTKFTGRGLGLAAVQGIVRGHKAGIQVKSALGEGTTFRILFPISNANVLPPRESIVPLENFRGTGTILLVDDEEIILSMGEEMLEMLGFQTLTAANGREALELYQSQPDTIDCLILDLTMPDMDGEETFRELRRINPEVKIVISSGYSEQEVTQRFTGQTISGFIQKPYQMSTLVEALKKLGLSNA